MIILSILYDLTAFPLWRCNKKKSGNIAENKLSVSPSVI